MVDLEATVLKIGVIFQRQCSCQKKGWNHFITFRGALPNFPCAEFCISFHKWFEGLSWLLNNLNLSDADLQWLPRGDVNKCKNKSPKEIGLKCI